MNTLQNYHKIFQLPVTKNSTSFFDSNGNCCQNTNKEFVIKKYSIVFQTLQQNADFCCVVKNILHYDGDSRRERDNRLYDRQTHKKIVQIQIYLCIIQALIINFALYPLKVKVPAIPMSSITLRPTFIVKSHIITFCI